jgi:hypothetical protein
MKSIIVGALALATSALVAPVFVSSASATPLPEAALQLASPDITVDSVTVDFASNTLDVAGGTLFLDNTDLLFGSFTLQVIGLQSDLTFTSGSFSATDSQLFDGDQSLASTSLVAVGTDNGQIQFLFDNLTGGAAPLYQASSSFALILVNGLTGTPSFGADFADTTGNNADIAAIETAVPVPGMLALTLGGIAAARFMTRRS